MPSTMSNRLASSRHSLPPFDKARADACPANFDPARFPIIACHFFGLTSRAQPTNGACLRSTKEAT